MIHESIGNFGHLFVIISFITACLSAIAYGKGTLQNDLEQNSWRKLGRIVFIVHGIAVFGVVAILFAIIYNHYFEYHYAWSHSSLNLATEYMIASFWEGQEGSFLIWSFWQAILGLVIIKTNKKWEAPVMTIFAAVQAFLASMILGVVFGDVKIGSSPFMLVRDVLQDYRFVIDPNLVPEDGTGLNPLLQNYWMVIHPPVLFMGFATTLVPFSYAIAGLWVGKYKEWIRPALPWAIFSALTLGVGILMGGYWAYETLNFGGYWNWDPVENAVYVPWLILVAGIHTMITFKKSATALKSSIILVIATFILILYSTFLTRSGVLGSASVHSFTDLGLSGQLLCYLGFFTLVSIVFCLRAWKNIPSSDKEASTYSREFWIFIGALTLCLMAFQVIIPTSFPVFNRIIEAFGGISALAPPANQIEFYSQWQMIFAIAIALLSGTGQFFFWNKMDKDKLWSALSGPIIISLILSAIIFLTAKIFNPAYIVVLLAGMYSLVANLTILINLLRSKSYKLAGGSVAHIGIAMMLIGIMFSEGYSKSISINLSTLLVSYTWSDERNSTNIPLYLNESAKMDNYEITYRKEMVEAEDLGKIKKSYLDDTNDPYYKRVNQDYLEEGQILARKGDTVYLRNPENHYYEIAFKHLKTGKEFSLFPRVQENEEMGRAIPSPALKRFWNRDIYTHITAKPIFSEEAEWSEKESKEIKVGERFFVNDYVATLDRLERVDAVSFMELAPNDVAVKASISVRAENNETYLAQPLLIIQSNGAYDIYPDVIKEVASRIALEDIDPNNGVITLGVNTTQKDYIVLKALEKPHINVLWIGTLVMVAGFIIAVRRRYIEFMQMRDKGLE